MLANSSVVNDAGPEISAADTVWVLVSAGLIYIMIPGIGFYYGGSIQKKGVMSIFLTTCLTTAVVSFQWYFWGYSLSFSQTGSVFIGDLNNFALINIWDKQHPAAPTISELTFVLMQGMFACVTATLAFGAAVEKRRLPLHLVFLFIWSTLVYNFCCYWCWGPNGWLGDGLGFLDFAGGTPVHVCCGFSAIAYALIANPVKNTKTVAHVPESGPNIQLYIGTVLLWFGWFGFNGGSEAAVNSRAVNAVFVSNLSASVGGVTWMVLDMFKNKTKRVTLDGFCAGVIAGFSTITPASGFVSPYYALIFGVFGTLCCFIANELKPFLLRTIKYDDSCEIFVVHGVGGIIGTLLTGIFAENKIATMAGGSAIMGGWVDEHYMQILYQLCGVVVVAIWSFVGTYTILFTLEMIPFLSPYKKTKGNFKQVQTSECMCGANQPIVNKEEIPLKEVA